MASSAPSGPKPTLPGYDILDELGRGGMGVVYRARQLSLNRLVALKMILAGSHSSQQQVDRFRREAEAVARLQHPNIVQIYEIGEHEGLPYLALELVRGPSLDSAVHAQSLSPRRAAQLLETLARAMHHVHQQGIIHRDLKPPNVLLQSADCKSLGSVEFEPGKPDWNATSFDIELAIPKITDFGLAKLLDDNGAHCPTRALVGTPNYMAPEQAMGHGTAVGPLADVYALGAVLYELLTGRPPAQGQTMLETLQQVRTLDPVSPRHFNANLSRDLETICLKCLQKNPGQRYASALDLAEDLRRFLDHQPILARPARLWERAAKWTMRRPALAGLIAVVAAAVVALSLVQLRHALALEATAEHARLNERIGQFERLQQARAALRQFTQNRGDAVFHWSFATFLASGDAPAHLEETRKAAEKALALVDLCGDSRTAPTLSPYWSQREKAEVLTGSHQLLLMLADATANPDTTKPIASQRQSFEAGLGILDRAAKAFPPTQAYHLRRARYLTGLGDEAEALREFHRAAHVPPNSFVDHLLAGHEQYQRGETKAAAQSFQMALAQEPADFWSQCLLALCQLKLNRPAEAQANLTRCIAQKPDFMWIHMLRGLAYGELNAFGSAESDFAAALKLGSDAESLYAVHVSRGLMRFRQKKLYAAIADLEEAISLKPEHFQARMTLARVHQTQNAFDKSNDQFDQVLRLHPGASLEAECHAERSRNFCLAKRYLDALTASDAAIAIRPNNAEAFQRRAVALLELKRFEEALQDLKHFVVKGGTPGLEFYRVRGHAKMQLADYLGAREDFTRALDLELGADLLAHRGWAYCFADAWKPALRDFDEAIRLDPRHADAVTGRGLAWVMLGNLPNAIADADEAIRLQPQMPEMMHNIACIFALAAAQADKSAADSELHTTAAVYRDRALQAVRQTLSMVALDDRPAFWRDKICRDDALSSIRNCAAFKELQRRYSD